MSSQAKQPQAQSTQQLPIFVYGTLRKGEPNYGLLRGHTCLEKTAYINHIDLYAYNDLPVAVPGTHCIVGEIMTIAPGAYSQTLGLIDLLEGHFPDQPVQSTYERVARQATCEDGQVIACWIYLWQGEIQSTYQPIQSGDWLTYRQERIIRARKMVRAGHHDQ